MGKLGCNKKKESVALYCRAANSNEEMEKIQLDLLMQYARKMGHQNCTTYCDWNTSGLTIDRPQLQELLADIYLSKVKRIIIQDISRLSRSPSDILDLLSQFDEYGVELISIGNGGVMTNKSVFKMGDDILDSIRKIQLSEKQYSC